MRAELIRAESQVRNVRESSQGPMVSLREGMGRRVCTAILNASERSSSQLLRRDMTADE